MSTAANCKIYTHEKEITLYINVQLNSPFLTDELLI